MLPWDLLIVGWARIQTYTSSRILIRNPPKIPVASLHLGLFLRMRVMKRSYSISIRAVFRVHSSVAAMLCSDRGLRLCRCLRVVVFEGWYPWSLNLHLCSACMRSPGTIQVRRGWGRWLVRGPRTSVLGVDSDQGQRWQWRSPCWVFRRKQGYDCKYGV